jgi:hypothetical protein
VVVGQTKYQHEGSEVVQQIVARLSPMLARFLTVFDKARDDCDQII